MARHLSLLAAMTLLQIALALRNLLVAPLVERLLVVVVQEGRMVLDFLIQAPQAVRAILVLVGLEVLAGFLMAIQAAPEPKWRAGLGQAAAAAARMAELELVALEVIMVVVGAVLLLGLAGLVLPASFYLAITLQVAAPLSTS